MSNKRLRGGVSSKISYAIIVVFIVLLLLAVLGFFARFTNGFTSDFATFYVEYDGKTITYDKGGYVFDIGEEYDFKVGYSLDFVNKDKLTYSVKVVPNVTDKTDFIYQTADGIYRLSDTEDLTEFFEIKEGESGFTLIPQCRLSEMLSQLRGDDVSGVPVVDGSSEDYLKLVISSEDGSTKINLTFNAAVPTESIIINGGGIIAG